MSERATTLVTGGTGFLGSALVRRLVESGERVRVLDNDWRGRASRLADVVDQIELLEGDIRDAAVVRRAVDGIQSIWHLASVNGTEHFYRHPDLVLDVGVRGMLNLVDAIDAEQTKFPTTFSGGSVRDLFLASSSEVYQSPAAIPTDERIPSVIPDVLNPRYSYAGAKLISELMAMHWASGLVERVVVFRPHNVYGPDMGAEHVIPEFILRMADLTVGSATGKGQAIDFPIEGTGRETRAFMHVDDFVDALVHLRERAEHCGIYHVGTDNETSIQALADEIARCFDRRIRIVPGRLKPGSVARRCPDIGRLRALGFTPRVPLREGIEKTVRWYRDNLDGYRDTGRKVA